MYKSCWCAWPVAVLLAGAVWAADVGGQAPQADAQRPAVPIPVAQENVKHDRHLYPHNARHPRVSDSARFHTNRDGAPLNLPTEDEMFTFVVFGDRTGGPAAGINVLADAVRDVNLLEPDLVMTVGDLINGYNRTPEWLRQMAEYKSVMDKLLCPWFPVAGNHDTYWRGPSELRPAAEHDPNYELHFGPLWYAFEHKNALFVALYSDEGNPETGEKSFRKPETQRMSPAQFDWLTDTLDDHADKEHVFVFLHHPRWLKGGYGDDWDRVHELLVKAGNVTAVFAGHIHHMRYDPRDGIDYITLATVGGGQSMRVPQAGFLHQYHVVTVRDQQVALASVPVGEVMDVREITGALQAECSQLSGLRPTFEGKIDLASNGSGSGRVRVTVTNPVSRPIDVTLTPDSGDNRWRCLPDHTHQVIEPGASHTFEFAALRDGGTLDDYFLPAELVLHIDYLARGHRYTIPAIRTPLPINIDMPTPSRPTRESVLRLDGENDCIMIPTEYVHVPDGPLTLECWMNAESFSNRVGLLAKTEGSEFGIFVSNGTPGFSVHLDGSYANARSSDLKLETGRWYHVAGVFDGQEVRLYVDGQQVAATERSGARRRNSLPLIIGADTRGNGEPMSFFHGAIDEVRLSTVARYAGEQFTPQRRFSSDDQTVLLLHMDGQLGPWVHDSSPLEQHPRRFGGAQVEVLAGN